MKPNDKAIEAGYDACTTVSRSIVIDIITAAYAAQFQSEDYAGLVKQLRFIDEDTLNIEPYSCEQLCKSAADALEALMAVNAEFSVVFKERDAAIAERDALAARLAPVEDEALVEIAAYYFTDGSSWSALSERLRNICRRDARNVIAAIRPHIEAAERERCAKIAETPELWVTDKPTRGCDDIAAAIRSGK